jgi:hypothetical protein
MKKGNEKQNFKSSTGIPACDWLFRDLRKDELIQQLEKINSILKKPMS